MKQAFLIWLVAIVGMTGCVTMKRTVRAELTAILDEAKEQGTCEVVFEKVQGFIDSKLK